MIGHDSLHCICPDFTMIALCFKHNWLILKWTKWFNRKTVAKLCWYFLNKLKWVTSWQVTRSEISMHTRGKKNQNFQRLKHHYITISRIITPQNSCMSFTWSKVQISRDAFEKIAFFAFHTFIVEDSRIEQKSSQGQTTQLLCMCL